MAWCQVLRMSDPQPCNLLHLWVFLVPMSIHVMEGWQAVAATFSDGHQKAGGMCGARQHGAGAAVGPTMQLQWRAGVHGRGPVTPPKGCFIFSYTMGVGGGGPNCCATDIRSLPLARCGPSMGQWGWHAAAPWACPTSMMLMVGCLDGLVSSTEYVRPPTVQSAPSLGFPCAHEYPCHGGLACSGSNIF